MRKALPRMLDVSRDLIAYESAAGQSSDAGLATTAICEKLRPKLSTLMGATGFRALLARALALATAEVPSLCDLEIDSGHRLIYRVNHSGQTAGSNDVNGGVELIAHMLSLLVAFIGEKLTRQLLLEIWPQAFGNDSRFQTGESS